MNNSVFWKTMENVRNHRDIKLVTSDKRRKQLVSKPNYHSHKKFSEHLIATEMIGVKMIKPLYLSILDISKILMYEFRDYYIKTEDSFEDIPNGVERWFDTSKAKGTKKCVIKQKLMFENYKACLFNNKTIYIYIYKFTSGCHSQTTPSSEWR